MRQLAFSKIKYLAPFSADFALTRCVMVRCRHDRVLLGSTLAFLFSLLYIPNRSCLFLSNFGVDADCKSFRSVCFVVPNDMSNGATMLLLLFFLFIFLARHFFFLLYVSKLFLYCVLSNGRVRFLFLSDWSVHDCSTPCRVHGCFGGRAADGIQPHKWG